MKLIRWAAPPRPADLEGRKGRKGLLVHARLEVVYRRRPSVRAQLWGSDMKKGRRGKGGGKGTYSTEETPR
jgi:hypothetical protein